MPRSSVPALAALVLVLLLGAPASARAAMPANTEPPAITGAAREGQTLGRTTGTWTGTEPVAFAQRWQRCAADGLECVNLPATGATYTPVAVDVGSTLRVVVTASNAEGVASAPSAVTAVVTGTAPANTAAPVVSGNAREGQVLTAGRGTWSGTLPQSYAYEWRRCAAGGASCAPVAGRTGETFALTAADVGATIRVRVLATNAAGTGEATSAATAVVGPPAPPVATAAPAVSGTARDGSTLSSTTGTWTGASTISYSRRWQRCDALGLACLDTAATTPTYALGPADIGGTIRLVVTAANPDGTATATSAPTAVVAPNPPAATAVPTLAGAARVGQAITATTGTWSGTAPLSFALEWRRCDASGGSCTAVPEAGGTSYVLTEADRDRTIRLAVTATNAAGTATGVSNPTGVVGPAQPPVNTAAPTVTGTVVDGQTLTSATGTWTGAPTIAYTRRWQRCDALGIACADTGASAPTYRLTPADVGATLRLVVVATNPDGTAAATSAPTGVVAPLAPINVTPPAVTGAAKDLQTLSASTGAWNGTTPLAFAYQWQRCDAAGQSCAAIPGATAPTRVLVDADLGATLRVQVTAANGAGSAVATSGATAVVGPAAPAGTAAPAVSGTARDGATLTATPGTWTGTAPITFTYQWRRCTAAGASCKDLPGATGPDHGLTPADVGSTLVVRVTGTNPGGTGSASSSPTAVVAAAPPAAAAPPTVSGTAVDGMTLTAAPGTWTGTPPMALAHRWERCDALLDCRAIPGATASSYTLTSADVGRDVRVAVTATNAAGSTTATSAGTGLVAPLAPVATTDPAVTGTARDGRVLTLTPPAWAGTTPIATAVRWRRCDADGAGCADVAGATGTTFELSAGDVGATIRAAVTATNAGGSTTAQSRQTPVVAAAPPVNVVMPAVTGVARDGRTVVVEPGEWDGTAPLEVRHRWRRCSAAGAQCTDIEGAASASYTLTTADVGSTVRAVLTVTNGGGTASATTDATGVVQSSPPVNRRAPVISGRVVDGELVTVSDGEWTGVVPISTTHRWWHCNGTGEDCSVIPGAGGATYRVGSADVGLTLRAEVVARNAGGATSAFTDATPVGEPAPPVGTAPPVVRGHHGAGQTLEATRGSWVGSPTLAYAFQWQRCDAAGNACTDVDGADADALVLAPEDVGARFRVRVTASNPAGSATAVSAPSPIVRDDPPVNTAAPAVTGTRVADGVALGSDPGSWAGQQPMDPAYQWRRCDAHGLACADVAGATAASYTPVTADVGGTLRVVVTMDNGVGLGAATSPPSAVVGPAPPRAISPPVVSAAGLRPGRVLTGDVGEWRGAAPLAHGLQWLRCALDGEDCAPIADATAAAYTLVGADIGHLLRLEVTTTNAAGTASARSAPAGPVLALAPVTTGRPTIAMTGKAPRPGSVLRADAGTWTGTAPLRFAYRWQSCVSATDCRDIATATGAERIVAAEDVGHRLRVVVTVANPGGEASAESAATEVVSGLAPAAEAKPQVLGTPVDGGTLAAEPGRWSGTAPLAHTYEWQRCAGAKCEPIDGATAARYTAEAADVGARLAVEVTTTSPYGKAEARSAPSAVVAALPPRRVTRPRVSRLPAVLEAGTRLKGRSGTWAGSDPLELSYQWLRCNAHGRRCRMVEGATEPAYTLVEADLRGRRLRRPLRLAVTATNAAGDATVRSPAVGARKPPARPRLDFAAAAYSKGTLALAVSCRAGAVPCVGTVVAAGARTAVDVPAGGGTLVLLVPRGAPGETVRARFRPGAASAGARVVTRLAVVRPPAGGGTRRRP